MQPNLSFEDSIALVADCEKHLLVRNNGESLAFIWYPKHISVMILRRSSNLNSRSSNHSQNFWPKKISDCWEKYSLSVFVTVKNKNVSKKVNKGLAPPGDKLFFLKLKVTLVLSSLKKQSHWSSQDTTTDRSNFRQKLPKTF